MKIFITLLLVLLIVGCNNVSIKYDDEMKYGDSYGVEQKQKDCEVFPRCDKLFRIYPERVNYCCIFVENNISIREVNYG